MHQKAQNWFKIKLLESCIKPKLQGAQRDLRAFEQKTTALDSTQLCMLGEGRNLRDSSTLLYEAHLQLRDFYVNVIGSIYLETPEQNESQSTTIYFIFKNKLFTDRASVSNFCLLLLLILRQVEFFQNIEIPVFFELQTLEKIHSYRTVSNAFLANQADYAPEDDIKRVDGKLYTTT